MQEHRALFSVCKHTCHDFGNTFIEEGVQNVVQGTYNVCILDGTSVPLEMSNRN